MQLRWYQQEACESTWQALTSGKGNPLIDLPTGSGKSLVLAELARKAVTDYAGRVVILAHRKELLRQNAKKVAALCDIKTGIYSAGLSSRDIEQPIIVGGIQSIYNKAHELGRRHLVLIDEAHLTPKSDDGMYRTFLAELEKYNPKLKIVGLTATPYRLDSGKLWGPGELFSHVCYRADIRKLIEEGFLSNLVNKPSSTQYDTSGLHTRAGEFVGREVADLFGDDYLMRQACTELVAKTQGRKSIIVFCAGVEHAEQVAQVLSDMTGERVDVVTGETPKLIREETLDTFGHGGFRFLCNVDVLTTGFDSPRIDCVAIMRATQSAGLFCQMVGRGLRTFPGKADALIVDFGGNLKRHGPIDAVDFSKQSSRGGTGDAPTKYCPSCEEQVPAGTRICGCGFAFTFRKAEHEQSSDEESKVLSEPETMEVAYWTLTRHKKKDKPDAPNTLRVSYCAPGDLGKVVEEWVCLNHDGFAGNKARAWWREHSTENIDEIAEALDLDRVGAAMHIEQRGHVRRPVQITYVRDGKFYRVIGRVLGELEKVVEEELPF